MNLIEQMLSMTPERDPMLDINMQSSLHGMLIAVGALDEDSKVRGCDLPTLANDWLATYHPHLIYKEGDE
jgi:hypothetical protein